MAGETGLGKLRENFREGRLRGPSSLRLCLVESGIPDINLALNDLQHKYIKIPGEASIICPNPTSGNFEIIFPAPPENVTIELFSINGKSLLRKTFTGFAGRVIHIAELENRVQGIYFLRITDSSGTHVHKIIKLKI